MSNSVAGLLAMLVLALTAVVLFLLCRMSDTGHGSRLKDLDEGIKRFRKAKSLGAKLFIAFYFARTYARMGQWGFAAAAIGALGMMAAAIFGGGWEIGRQMLCDVLRFVERLVTGQAKSCEPVPTAQ